MGIVHHILGQAGQDNALAVTINTGQALHRLLFDCGEGCVSTLAFSEVLENDHVFFSHFHMDHVAGFDSFLRAVFNRENKDTQVWGPPGTSEVMRHRLQGFTWNLQSAFGRPWLVHDVLETRVDTTVFQRIDAFPTASVTASRPHDGLILEHPEFTVRALPMDHGTTSLAYIVQESPRWNVNLERLGDLGLKPGPWLRQLKDLAFQADTVDVHGMAHNLNNLRAELLSSTPGDSIAYLTDFLMDDTALERLVQALQGVRVIVCESQYRHADLELAVRNKHMTAHQAASLAARAGAQELVLFHLSDRYTVLEWQALREEAQQVFPNTRFAEHWGITAS